jgi:hypothetical protein
LIAVDAIARTELQCMKLVYKAIFERVVAPPATRYRLASTDLPLSATPRRGGRSIHRDCCKRGRPLNWTTCNVHFLPLMFGSRTSASHGGIGPVGGVEWANNPPASTGICGGF